MPNCRSRRLTRALRTGDGGSALRSAGREALSTSDTSTTSLDASAQSLSIELFFQPLLRLEAPLINRGSQWRLYLSATGLPCFELSGNAAVCATVELPLDQWSHITGTQVSCVAASSPSQQPCTMKRRDTRRCTSTPPKLCEPAATVQEQLAPPCRC